MAELRHLIDSDQVEQLWSKKDDLGLLRDDPLRMYKGKFVHYLELKGQELLEEYTAAGLEADEAHAKVAADLTALTAEWKAEAARRHK